MLKKLNFGILKIFPTCNRPGSGTGSLAWIRLVDTLSELGSQRRPSSAREQKTYPRQNQKFEALVQAILGRIQIEARVSKRHSLWEIAKWAWVQFVRNPTSGGSHSTYMISSRLADFRKLFKIMRYLENYSWRVFFSRRKKKIIGPEL